ncbi:MAG: T9SS type A sorting domain-containing protein [candidate division WOR-3 bacterium]
MNLLLLVGAYATHVVASGLNYPHGIAIAEINGDGRPDILISATYGSQVYWYENSGFWTFAQHYVGSASYPLYVDAGDLDGDGDQDIVTGDYSYSGVYIFYNSGNGSSFASQLLPTSGSVWEVNLGDIDSDGDLDIAASTGGGVLWFRNDGAGVFTQIYVGSLYSPHGCRLFDMEGDGHLEIAASDPFQVFKNDGSENFTLIYQDATLQYAWGVGPMDINNDGFMDIAVNDYYAGATYVYWGNMFGGFTKQAVGLAGGAEGIDVGELNAHTGGDIAVGAADGWVICYYYAGSGFMIDIVDNLYDADLVIIADLNNDMCPDLVASGPMGNLVMAYENGNCPFQVGETAAGREPQFRIVYSGTGPVASLKDCSGSLVVYDATGRLIRSYPIEGSDQRINLSGLGPGVYAAMVMGVETQVFVVGR